MVWAGKVWGTRHYRFFDLALEHSGPDGAPIQTNIGVDVQWHNPDPQANREPPGGA